jgi:hypothetical protein
MLLRVTRIVRIVSTLAGFAAGVMELRTMYYKRKHMWNILRRLVRQLG